MHPTASWLASIWHQNGKDQSSAFIPEAKMGSSFKLWNAPYHVKSESHMLLSFRVRSVRGTAVSKIFWINLLNNCKSSTNLLTSDIDFRVSHSLTPFFCSAPILMLSCPARKLRISVLRVIESYPSTPTNNLFSLSRRNTVLKCIRCFSRESL